MRKMNSLCEVYFKACVNLLIWMALCDIRGHVTDIVAYVNLPHFVWCTYALLYILKTEPNDGFLNVSVGYFQTKLTLYTYVIFPIIILCMAHKLDLPEMLELRSVSFLIPSFDFWNSDLYSSSHHSPAPQYGWNIEVLNHNLSFFHSLVWNSVFKRMLSSTYGRITLEKQLSYNSYFKSPSHSWRVKSMAL